MKKLLLALLFLTSPAFAQTQTQYYTVPTIAALKAMTTSRPTVVQVVDANPGIFNLSTGACSAADDIFQVQPTSGTTVCYTRAATPYFVGKNPAFTGAITLPNGTAAAPSVAFSADTNTGFYRISSGKIGMSLSGSRFGSFDSTGNFIFGSGTPSAGQALTTGTNNFLWGSRAGGQMTTASDQIIMGLDAGLYLTTNAGVNVGAPNVYIGYAAGKASTGGGNVAVGLVAGGGSALASTDVYSMTAVGEYALSNVIGSQKDTAVGSYALTHYKRGGQMVAIGRGAGTFLQEGAYSFLAGHAAGYFSVSSVQNIFIGDEAGVPNGAMVGAPPRITASQSGTVLTVTAFNAGDAALAVGMVGVSSIAAALPANITITSFGTGTGGTGTYNVTPSQSVSSQTMAFGQATSYNIAMGTSVGSLGYTDSNNILLGNNIAMASASNMTVVGRGQTAANVSGSFAHGTTSTAINNAAGVTLTAAQIYGKTIIRSGAVAVADTTPTAAQIVAAIPACEIGSTFDFDIINNNTGLLTITAGSGVTLSGTTTIATLFTRRYRARVTSITASSEAVTLLGVFTAPGTGTWTFGDGTAAAPSVAFSADTTTGFYRISSGKIGMSLSGVRFGSFDSTGNFIFGSGTPSAGQSLTTGSGNFLWGSRAGGQMTTASNHIIMGLDAGLYLTTDAGANPSAPNVYIGYTAGKASTGGGNVAVGLVAGGGSALASTDVYSMTAVGEYALSNVIGSQKDTAVGSYALTHYKRGGQMVAIGRGAGTFLQEGAYSFLAGHAAGYFSVSSVQNIFIGDEAGVPNGAMVGAPPRITASQSGTVLTVTAFNAGDAALAVGMVGVSSIAAALPANITITSFGTGTGGTGTYNVTPSQSVSSQTMAFGQATSYNIAMGTSVGSLGYTDSNNILLGNNIAMASASNMTVVGRGQTAANVSGSFAHGTTSTAINNAAGVTLTAAQIYGKTIIRSGAVAVADTTPTAAQIVAAIPACEIGSTFDFDIINNNTGLLTITAGSGVTLSGTTTIATLFTRRYRARVTNITASSEAVTLLGVFTAAN